MDEAPGTMSILKDDAEPINRRGFIRSLFSLGGLHAATSTCDARAKAAFVWCDLLNGNVGFPTGLSVPTEKPGSLMKLVAAACLVEENLLSLNEKFECTGTFAVGGRVAGKRDTSVHCQFAHGKVDLVRALAVSCNCFFAQATSRLTKRTFLAKARQLGLASPVAGRRGGIFPDGESASGQSSLPYVLGLAEDFKPSCLQLMRMAALIAVGPEGKLPVLHSSENFTLAEKEKPLSVGLTSQAREVLVAGMRHCVLEGTARKLDTQDKLKIAAKTGTTPHGKTFQSHIIGFFPFDKPRNAFCLFAPAGTSQDAAVPEAREILFSTTW